MRTVIKVVMVCLALGCAHIIQAMAAEEIDKAILQKLNTGQRLGTHPAFPKPIPRVADRIVSLHVNVVSVDSLQDVMFEPVGTRTGEERYYAWVNCGSKEEKKQFKDSFTFEKSGEVEFTEAIKTSSSFKGKLTANGGFLWAKFGAEAEASFGKEVTVTDKNKRVTIAKNAKEESFEFTAPPHTYVIYRATTSGGTKKQKFAGTVVVSGVYHYVIGDIWDQNGNIDDILKNEQERTFPFAGFLSTISLTKLSLERYERPLDDKTC